MPKIAYIKHHFNITTRNRVQQAREILAEYARQGYRITLRQLYYQFVSRGFLANTHKNYKKLGQTISDARLAGLIDWNAIEDRTRNLMGNAHWDSPADIMISASHSFRIDKWANQFARVEVWVEKEALVGVFERICSELDVPYFACKGYTSQSEMWHGAMRMARYAKGGQQVHILHFGDHDPSGIDMTRDVLERIKLFLGSEAKRFHLKRIALNMRQVKKYGPPPNPTKETDSRHKEYTARFGSNCWELDALEPSVLVALATRHIKALRDDARWNRDAAKEERMRRLLRAAARHWPDITKMISKKRWLGK
jgi:hypothetical protein